MNKPCILIVEDDADLREAIGDTLSVSGFSYAVAENGAEALKKCREQDFHLVLCDVQMPEMDGHHFLKTIKEQQSHTVPIIMMSAHGTIKSAVQAIRDGAIDYLAKPFATAALLEKVKQFTQYTPSRGEPIAVAPSSQALLALAKRAAQTNITVLITGESGTGKEVLARFIHEHSPRAHQPFIAINCAAIPESMLEGILFGYEKGAFTGALKNTPGKLEQAQGGTLLLDEITEMPLPLQAKLLRVLQEKEVERLGSQKTISLDIRIIATSNRDMLSAVKNHQFREDLYYRLNVFPLQWKSLRERTEDIIPLADAMLKKMDPKQRPLSDSAKKTLLQHTWPGNVRELHNVLQRAVVMSDGLNIEAHSLLIEHSPTHHEHTPKNNHPENTTLAENRLKQEYHDIIQAMHQWGGSQEDLAHHLGISARTLRYKMARLKNLGFSFPKNTRYPMNHGDSR